MITELSPFHVQCLQTFQTVAGLTESALARRMQVEKAVAKFAIKTLHTAGFLRQTSAYNYTIADGVLYLKQQKAPKAEAPTEKPAIVKPVELDTLEVLDIPETDADALQALEAMTGDEDAPDFYGAMAAAMNIAAPYEAIVRDLAAELTEQAAVSVKDGDVIIDTSKMSDATFDKFQTWAANIKVPAKPAAEPAPEFKSAVIAELPAIQQADFGTLVRQGLARLNSQLGLKPVKIDEPKLKVEALTKLSDSLKDFDLPLSVLLNDIARDIQNAADRV